MSKSEITHKHKPTHRHSFLPSLIEKKSFNLNLLIGLDENGQKIALNEKSLYQNILITGTIGTGKTSSAMYPFTKQLISYNSDDITSKTECVLESCLTVLPLVEKGADYGEQC